MIFNIQQFIDHNYATDTRKDRRNGKGGTQEFFTPFSIVQKMCNMVSDEDWSDPEKTFLESSFGMTRLFFIFIYIVDYEE